ncbi:ribosomal protein S18-alanine N-acetyltransferase [Rothia halotolerans]|uniref:ribosomal protein S18-alanine N-acetyltransferase n=1 Tax=Rothia halotolerans TaxID=405770 RepID=UPI00101CB66C|nr:ribosomal protein S18-alanine N-acetyltransferase [Rothia halotolerans]
MSPADSPGGPPPSIGPRPSAAPAASPASTGPSPEPPPPAGYAARPLELADLEAVHRFELRLFPADAWPLEMFLAEVRHPTRRYTVVLDEAGVVVGYAGMMAVAETGDVQTIAVDPGHEGRGLGRWLMERMHRQAREAGAGTMMLEVRADNPRAAGLYESLGYARIHLRPRYYQDGVDAVIMSKDLTPEGGPRP